MVLQSLRKGASGLIAKAFLLLLTVSFVIWGIADVFRGFGASTVATVGGTDISANDFRARYLDQVQQLGRRTGRGISPDQARAIGIDRQVLGQMIAEATLDEQARLMGLAVGDDMVAAAIRENPAFRPPGSSGFDPAYFQQLLRSNGLTEPRFVASERGRMLRDQAMRPLVAGVTTPVPLRDAIHRYESESRSVAYVIVTPTAAGPLPAPTDEQLKTFYDAQRITFRAPEYRKVSVLALTPDTLAASIQPTDEELRADYQRERARFGTPERREVQQIVFPDPAEAAAAAEKIKAGTSFADIAAARGLAARDFDLGLVARSAILDPKVADAAFALPADGTSGPVAGRFGTVLVHVGRIEPESIRPFDEVAPQLRQQIALDKARRLILDKHDAVEDERASGATLAETAQKLGLTLQVVDAVDRSGFDPAGAQVQIPGRADVLAGAFQSAPGVETDTIQLPQNGGFVWYETTAVTPSRERPFEEVRAQVLERWNEDAVAKAVEAKAADLLAKARAGTPLADLAAASGLTVATSSGLMRGRANAVFNAQAVARVFEAAVNGFGTAPAATAPDMVLFQVTGSELPPQAQLEAGIDAQIAQQIETDLLMQYLAGLQSKVGVKINDRVVQQAIGAGTTN